MIRMSIRALSVLALFVIAALTAGIALRESTISQRVTIAAGPDDGGLGSFPRGEGGWQYQLTLSVILIAAVPQIVP